MVFKNEAFFSSKKSSDSYGSSSPIPSEEKKPKSGSKDDPTQIPSSATSSFGGVACRQTQVNDGVKKKEVEGKETTSILTSSVLISTTSTTSSPTEQKEAASVASPILASSLGLNRIKTRSGPLPQKSFFSFKGDKAAANNLWRGVGDENSSSAKSLASGKKEMGFNESVGGDSSSIGGQSREQSPNLLAKVRLQSGESSSEAGCYESSWGHTVGLRSLELCTPQTSYDCENPNESVSPRFEDILRLTSAPRKRFPADIKSFSHELNSKGVRPFPFMKPRGINNLEEILVVIRAKFNKAKEEVNSDLAIFAGDLVRILEKKAESHPEWQEPIEDLLVLAKSCAMTSPGEFWLQCEGIEQELDDRRQELPPGVLKQLHTKMLFILTRCTRLLQFHKDSGLAEDVNVLKLYQSRVLHSADKRITQGIGRDTKGFNTVKASKAASARKSYGQEQRGMGWKKDHVMLEGNILCPIDDTAKNLDSPASRDPMASWKKLPSPVGKIKSSPTSKEQTESENDLLKPSNHRRGKSDVDMTASKPPELPSKENLEHSSKHQHKVSWGYWRDQQNISDYSSSIICRICEEDVPTSHVEDHSRICAIAVQCEQKGLSVNEQLVRMAETLKKMMESFGQKDIYQAVVGSPDVAKVSNSSLTEESDVLSPKFSDWSRRDSKDLLDYVPEADNSGFMDCLKGLPSMSCKTSFGPKSDQGMTTSSAGSMTPVSPLLTPRTSQIDLLLAGKGTYSEHDDFPQINELADIARCSATTPLNDGRSIPYLLTCLEDLRVVIDRRKFDALIVETFGTRIEKLIREKYLHLCELVDDDKADISSAVIDEDASLEDDVVRSLRTSPTHSSKDRTSIEHFEIIKPISRGAFGRVFLAKKRTTGDIFAIKVFKKADIIRNNAVESILAERDILISVCNPFVVRFFYSFTCRENLYFVMEYLNGGDLYSLLRNLGCLDEDVARVYIAEVVLALEYLHSLHVVHHNLKPGNLFIAHDGHIKLTDFGLSKVADDLSGPAVTGTSMMEDDEPQLTVSEHQRERLKKRSAIGISDYLAPEMLLGTGHGTTADWWSVGVILFELIVGIPPFNAEHPQVPWPSVPNKMSAEAQDLIDRLLTEDPHQRLGAGGASEVKQHIFFKEINWDTLARQKAAFVPTSESALDTSNVTSRYSRNTWDDHVYPASDFEDSSDDDSLSGSSSCLSNRQEEVGDECGGLAESESGSTVNYYFSNFSFKNISQLASINHDILLKGRKDDPKNPNA